MARTPKVAKRVRATPWNSGPLDSLSDIRRDTDMVVLSRKRARAAQARQGIGGPLRLTMCQWRLPADARTLAEHHGILGREISLSELLHFLHARAVVVAKRANVELPPMLPTTTDDDSAFAGLLNLNRWAAQQASAGTCPGAAGEVMGGADTANGDRLTEVSSSTVEPKMLVASWYSKATDKALYPELLRQACCGGRIAGKKQGGRWYYELASVCAIYPEYSARLNAKYSETVESK